MLEDPLSLRATRYLKLRRVHTHRRWLQVLARVRPHHAPPERPIFVLGCPRSGTTLLFRLLRRHEALGSPRGEGHVLWNANHHPARTGWSSDRVTDSDVVTGERRYVYTGVEWLSRGGRFLDKTPRNCLRVPYLAELFPGATYVLLKRNGPAVAEVTALQYRACYEAVLDDLAAIDPAAVNEISFEDLLARPTEETRRLLEGLGLPPSRAVMDMASNLGAHPVQTNSPPRPEKWRDRAADIARVLPRIAPTMERLGYDAGAVADELGEGAGRP